MDSTTANSEPTWLDRTLYPFRDHWLDLDGHRIHYVDEGTGPVLLIVHGNGEWSFSFREIIRALSPHFRCIVPDHPGFGLSVAARGFSFRPAAYSTVLERFVEALGLTHLDLLVHDWGGPIGLGFAGRRPELVRNLYITNTWAWPADDSKPLNDWSRMAGGPLGRFLITRFNVLATVLLSRGMSRKLTRAERAAYAKPYPTPASRYPQALLPKEIVDSRDFLVDVEAGLAKLVDKPVLLLWGDADPGFGEAELERFRRRFPHATLRMLPGANHFVEEDAPAAISDAILAFARSHDHNA